MELTGAVGLVTGAASGLGAAVVRRLTEAGMSIVGFDLVPGDMSGVAFVQGDVCSEEDVQAALTIASELGPLRVAVHCAGVGWAAPLVSRSGRPHGLADFRRIVEINLVGTFNVLRMTASAMAGCQPCAGDLRGVVVTTASVAAFESWRGTSAYAAAKAGVAGLTLPAARDLARHGVRVVAIAPGLFDTPMAEGVPFADDLVAMVQAPRRPGRAYEEFAALVEHVVRNDYLNGETIRLDGGVRFGPL